MYKPENYTIQELAHPQIIRTIGERNTWRRLDEDCLRDLQTIREEWFARHGSGVYCNRLNLGLDSRGLRAPNDKDGAMYSSHKQGRAFDLEPVNGKIRELYDFIIKLIEDGSLTKLNTLEHIDDTSRIIDGVLTPRWVHVANMNTYKNPLIIRL